VSAIDEVYPELKLAERLNKAQYAMSPTLPLPPPRAWPGVREPAHMMTASQWASEPLPNPWRQAMSEIAQVMDRYKPSPDPWKDQLLSEIASLMGKYSYGMLNPQPLPPGAAAWPGVREPAHMMVPQWASSPQPNPGARSWRRSLRCWEDMDRLPSRGKISYCPRLRMSWPGSAMQCSTPSRYLQALQRGPE